LRLAVLDAVGGHLDYCDPDQYPVAHGSPLEAARVRLPMIQADAEVFDAILAHEHLSTSQALTDDQLLAVNDLYKQMQAIDLTADAGGYRFDVLIPAPGASAENERVTGEVDPAGAVSIETRSSGQPIVCPVCLAAGVLISTPHGDVVVQDIRVGMAVWTTDRLGRQVPALVLRVGHMAAPVDHVVVRVELADGRVVVASPGHPVADGRPIGDLAVGDRLEGTRVVRVVLAPYTGQTYDLLPSGPTGTYIAGGILMDSTLAESEAVRPALGYGSVNT
jgi:hypothetical protein